jgi:hypothetical protein
MEHFITKIIVVYLIKDLDKDKRDDFCKKLMLALDEETNNKSVIKYIEGPNNENEKDIFSFINDAYNTNDFDFVIYNTTSPRLDLDVHVEDLYIITDTDDSTFENAIQFCLN